MIYLFDFLPCSQPEDWGRDPNGRRRYLPCGLKGVFEVIDGPFAGEVFCRRHGMLALIAGFKVRRIDEAAA